MGPVWLLTGAILLAEACVWLGFVWWRRVAGKSRSVLRVVALAATPVLVLYAYVSVAPLASPYEMLPASGAVVLDAHGVVLQRDQSDGLRIPVTLDHVAPVMVEATIAAEDSRFRSHPGVDPIAIARALVEMPWHRSGASTITQQLARRLYIDPSTPLLERKAREMVLAMQLEARYSKDDILALYLNDVYYGRGAYGVEAASRVYFGVSASNLDLAQAAFLAGLPRRPADYGEQLDAAAVQARQQYVLGRMRSSHELSSEDAASALNETLTLLPAQAPVLAPHFVQYVLGELHRLRPDLAGQSGLVIETTLDSGLQQEAERQVGYQLNVLKDKNVGSAAVVVEEPSTGKLLTMVGNASFGAATGSQLNMALQPRQPGSALKPFLYAAAFDRGFTAASMLLDVPSSFDTPEGPYQPLDYDRRFRGPEPLRVALASSLNVPAVRTLDQIGVDALLDEAHRFGLDTLTDAEVYGLSLTLGGGEVRLLDLTNAYAALANGGLLTQPYGIERVLDASGRVVYQHQASAPLRVVSQQDAFILSDILSDNDARTLGFGYAPMLQLPFRAAVKTGTTTESRDNWTLGYTPERAVGVWVGNVNDASMRDVSGVDGAGPIWHGVMEAAFAGVTPTWRQPPAGVHQVTVCSPTGLLPGPYCPSPVEEWFKNGTEPAQVETYYQRDAAGRLVIHPPAEARAWATSAGLALADAPAGQDAVAFVVQPADGSVLYIAPELHDQQALLQASPPPGTQQVEFVIDGSSVAMVPASVANTVWSLIPGSHVLLVRALQAGGNVLTATTSFEVRK